MLPAKRRLRNSQQQFTPRQLFAAMQGAWLEPIIGNMWQENTGVTSVSASTQTVGLLLDQSQGMVLGPELLGNGDFSNGSTGWTLDSGINASGGELVFTNVAINMAASYLTDTLLAGLYRVTYRIKYITSGGSILRIVAGSQGQLLFTTEMTAPGIYVYYVTSNQSQTLSIQLRSSQSIASTNAVLDDVSIKQVFGNHAYQSVQANRPTYQLDSNSLPLVRHDTTDYLTASLPNLGGGVFSASGSVYFATPQGMSALHGQSMGTTLNLPALSSDIYAWCVTPARLNAAQEAKLQLYFNRKVGIVEPDYLTADSVGVLLMDDGVEAIYGG